MIPFLPLGAINETFQPALSEAALRVIKSGWYLQGQATKQFERSFADFVGVRYCVGVGNGLDALTLSLMALKQMYHWDEHTEVIVPNMTFVATAQAVVRAGMIPVFADVDKNALLTPSTAEHVLSPHTRAVLPVHLYGKAADMEAFAAWTKENHLKLLEDAAQAHGAYSGKKRVGSTALISAFSFYPGKNLGALGDGGAVTTDDEELAHRVRTLANYGADRKYHHVMQGLNSRLDEIQAAMLNVKLCRLDQDNLHRQHIASIYAEHIHNPLVELPYQGNTAHSVFHIYAARCQERERLSTYLQKNGIQTSCHYPLTLSEQPIFSSINCHTPRATEWARTQISLPVSPIMTDEEALTVCETINQFNL